jgi:seryl-tRNA synthetase
MSARVVTDDQQVVPAQDPRSVVAHAGSASPSVLSEPIALPVPIREVDSSLPAPTTTSWASSELVQKLTNQNIALLKEIQSIHERLEKLEQAYHLIEVQMIQVKESLPATIESSTQEQTTKPDSVPPATEQPATEQTVDGQPVNGQPVDDKPAVENDASTGKEKAPGKKKKNKKVAKSIDV